VILQIPGPTLVADILVVLATIGFDDHAMFAAGEIGDERADRELPMEFVAANCLPAGRTTGGAPRQSDFS
jgi:hypothetical protein